MRRTIVGFTAFFLFLAGAGLAVYLGTRPPKRGLSASDLGWVKRWIVWERDTYGMLTNAYDRAGRQASPESFGELRACRNSYDGSFDPAPKRRDEVHGISHESAGERARPSSSSEAPA